jgi:hypothetical protein
MVTGSCFFGESATKLYSKQEKQLIKNRIQDLEEELEKCQSSCFSFKNRNNNKIFNK